MLQELSASSCECDTSSGSRRSRRSTSHRSGRRRGSNNINNNNNVHLNNTSSVNNISNTKVQCHSDRDSPSAAAEASAANMDAISPGLSQAYRAMVGLAANGGGGGTRTPSIEQQSCCLTETTDCPSDASVITSISTLHNGGGGRRTASSAISPTASTTSSCSSSSSSFSKERRLSRGGQNDRRGASSCRLLLGGSRSQDFRPVAAAGAYSRSEEDLIQRLPDLSLASGAPSAGGGAMARLTLPPAALRSLVRERLREEGVSLSSHPYTQAVSFRKMYTRTGTPFTSLTGNLTALQSMSSNLPVCVHRLSVCKVVCSANVAVHSASLP